MKKLVYLLRENNKLFLITLIIVFIFLIGSMVMTSVSLIWGQRLLITFLSVTVDLMVFLGVNPILKGISLTLVPISIAMIFTELLDLISADIYERWVEADTARGGGPAGIIFYLILLLVIKFSGVQPYVKSLEEKEYKKHQ